MTFQALIAKIGKGQKGSQDLTPEEAAFAAEALLSGKATPLQAGAFLVALRIKEETVDELAAFTKTCRRSLHPALRAYQSAPQRRDLIDLPFYAGKKSSFHVGISASFLMAAAGLKVALHGDPNPPGRTSKSEVLSRLGWTPDISLEKRLQTLEKEGWAWFDISQIHPDLKRLLDLRNELGLRSVFHTVARLINPLNGAAQIVGISHPKSFQKAGETLSAIGTSHGLIIRGLEGESELNLSGPVEAMLVNGKNVTHAQLDPLILHLPPVQKEKILIQDLESEAGTVEKILQGTAEESQINLALWNAAAGLYVSRRTDTLKKGFEEVKTALLSGEAFKKLRRIMSVAGNHTH